MYSKSFFDILNICLFSYYTVGYLVQKCLASHHSNHFYFRRLHSPDIRRLNCPTFNPLIHFDYNTCYILSTFWSVRESILPQVPHNSLNILHTAWIFNVTALLMLLYFPSNLNLNTSQLYVFFMLFIVNNNFASATLAHQPSVVI